MLYGFAIDSENLLIFQLGLPVKLASRNPGNAFIEITANNADVEFTEEKTSDSTCVLVKRKTRAHITG